MSEPKPPRQAPLDPPMVPFALGGMAVFAVAGLILVIGHDRLATTGHQNWLWICLAGLLWGIPGWLFMKGHDRRRQARRATERSQAERPGGPAGDQPTTGGQP